MKSELDKVKLQCASIIPDHFAQKRWGKGAFVSTGHAFMAYENIGESLIALVWMKSLN